MFKIFSLTFSLLLVLIPFYVCAADGAVGFHCESEKKILLLDFYEYELLNKPKTIIKTNDSLNTILENRLDLLEKIDPKNAVHYKSRGKNLLQTMKLLEEVTLSRTNDSFEVARPAKCKAVQLALHHFKDGKTEFVFNKELWEKMDALTQAGLVLHEVIYEQFYLLGEKNSKKARALNALIFSSNFHEMDSNIYQKFLRDLKIPLY